MVDSQPVSQENPKVGSPGSTLVEMEVQGLAMLQLVMEDVL